MITHPLTKATRDAEKHSSLLQGGLGGHFSLCPLGYNSAGECPRRFESEEAPWTFGLACSARVGKRRRAYTQDLFRAIGVRLNACNEQFNFSCRWLRGSEAYSQDPTEK